MPIQVFKKLVPQAQAPAPAPKVIEKTIFGFDEKGNRFVGLSRGKHVGGGVRVALALPNDDGILLVSDEEIVLPEDRVEEFSGIAQAMKIRRFDSVSVLDEPDVKMSEIKDETTKLVVDYRDVMFEGLASTFKTVTPQDRQGDYINEGAFTKTIAKFLRNPVMLIDHDNSVRSIAGSYSKMSQIAAGLAVTGKVSNAPSLRDVRFLIVEGHLRAMSIGGMFYYGEDGREIKEVELYEISLVAVPANQDALFQVRKISIDDAAAAYKTFTLKAHGRLQTK